MKPARAGSSFARRRGAATLVRWLGPWASPTAVPDGVARTAQSLPVCEPPGGRVRCYRYAPTSRAPAGAYLVAQGLHYDGPDDPRMDRFCRILAAAGYLVCAPFVRDFLGLAVSPHAEADVATALAALADECDERRLPRPALFTISFGSLPGACAAARGALRDRVGGIVFFGAYRDFAATVRFATTARALDDGGSPLTLPHDPLNAPAGS
jgi:hypothetical protein